MTSKVLTPYEELKKEILLGIRLPGAVFDEKEFAAKFNVSRTPVREAVLKLAQEGFLTILPRRGTIVSPISFDGVNQLYEYRACLESQTAKFAAERGDKVLFAVWKEYFIKQLKNGGKESETLPGNKSFGLFPDSDAAFHIALAEATNNRYFVEAITHVMDSCQRIRYLSNRENVERLMESVAEHIKIVDGILSGDGNAAGGAMYEHLKNTAENMRKL